jgi:hypothetical protein
MDETQLKDLRKHMGQKFDSIGQLQDFLTDILMKERSGGYSLPVIVGFDDVPLSNWKLKILEPLDTRTKLTVDTYLEGLKELANTSGDYFEGGVCYKGLDHLGRHEVGNIVLGVYASDKHATGQVYGLNLNFQPESNGDSPRLKTYVAESFLDTTRLEKLCENFLGPNVTKRLP